MAKDKEQRAEPKYDASKKAVEKLAERLTKHGNVSSEKAHQIAVETARNSNKG